MPTEESTRATLIRRIASSPDQETWEEFYRRYGLLLRNFCWRTDLALDDRDELFQEVFLALLQSLPHFQYEKAKGSFRSYLWRVVRNQTLALHRRRLARPLPLHAEFLAGSPRPDPAWEEEWLQHHVRGALEQLDKETPSAQMRVFRLYVLEMRPVDEVASRCGCSVAMVYKTKSQLLAHLRKILKRRNALVS